MTELSSQRRYELDWLRVIAFGLLIYFHAAIVFVPNGLPLIQNADVSPVLHAFVAFLQEFRLGLLFLISGCGVYFATGRGSRSPQAFFRERSMRLLVPLLVGILIIVPPLVISVFDTRLKFGPLMIIGMIMPPPGSSTIGLAIFRGG